MAIAGRYQEAAQDVITQNTPCYQGWLVTQPIKEWDIISQTERHIGDMTLCLRRYTIPHNGFTEHWTQTERCATCKREVLNHERCIKLNDKARFQRTTYLGIIGNYLETKRRRWVFGEEDRPLTGVFNRFCEAMKKKFGCYGDKVL
jgi:hypothetical protein